MKTKRMFAEVLAILVVTAAAVMFLAAPSLAQKPFLERIRKTYGLEKEKTGNCKLCHSYDKDKGESPERDNLGVFGKDLQKVPGMKPLLGKDDDYKFTPEDLNIVEASMKTILEKDSDGDGATNGEELALTTFPGDPKSVPAKADLEKHRKK